MLSLLKNSLKLYKKDGYINGKIQTLDCCRFCLYTEDLKPIFDENTSASKRASDIKSILGLKVSPKDGLSQKICTTCSVTIKLVLNLRKVALKSKAKLTRIVTRNSQKTVKKKHKERKKISKEFIQVVNPDDFNDEIPYKNEINTLETTNNDTLTTLENIDNITDDIPENIDNISDEIPENIDNITDDFPSNDSPNEQDNTFQVEIKIESAVNVQSEEQQSNNQLLGGLIQLYKDGPDTSSGIDLGIDSDDSFDEKFKNWRQYKNKIPKKPKVNSNYCEICKKQYPDRKKYQSHASIHANVVVCELCGKKCYNSKLLLTHKRAKHGAERIHKCTLCDYTASSKAYLVVHNRRHTGEKPYICDYCGSGFHRRCNFIQHIASHLPDKNFECKICSKKFRSRRFIQIHMHNVHTGKRYRHQCPLCPTQYNKPYKVREHLRTVHGVNEPRLEIRRIEINAVVPQQEIFDEC